MLGQKATEQRPDGKRAAGIREATGTPESLYQTNIVNVLRHDHEISRVFPAPPAPALAGVEASA